MKINVLQTWTIHQPDDERHFVQNLQMLPKQHGHLFLHKTSHECHLQLKNLVIK